MAEYRINDNNVRAEELRDARRESALERQAVHDELSVQEKIAKLDARLGKGKGAKKERARLAKLLGKQ